MTPVLLKTENLTRQLDAEVPVMLVKDVSLEIQKGEFIAITGPSGSGKSSLLYLLGLLDKPSSGKIWLEEQDLSLCNEQQLAGLRLSKLGFVFQFHYLLPEFSALENVMLPMQRLGKLSAQQIKDQASELLLRLGLENQLHKFPKQLSGGQSQRVAIARALANEPILLLADEPTGNLDSASSQNVQMILKEIAHDYGRTVIVVTHDQRFATAADRIITIVDGKISL